jgi:Protein of unknown function (DUF3048) N-terminal domain/Protein of unknown function (DUF3048) C-terminal domain
MRKSTLKITKTVSILAIAGLVLAGCAEPEVEEPEAFVYPFAPLTGVAYMSESEIPDTNSLPAVSCKVDNAPAARPQFNLNKADIVHVQMVEGGLTRLLATWHSQPVDKVGPVRSVRPMDADIAAAYGGIFCYSGGVDMFIALLQDTSLYLADENTQQSVKPNSFSRTPERFAPHNMVVDMGLLQSQHEDLEAPQSIFNYAAFLEETQDYEPSSASSGKTASDLTIEYPSATSYWAGDGSGNLLRTQDGQPHMDGVSEEQVSAKNVVVLEVQIDNTTFRDARYGPIPKTIMIGSGKVWVFIDGKYIEGTWSKANQTAPIELLDSTGAVIKLAPGNTWVELKPDTVEMTITP